MSLHIGLSSVLKNYVEHEKIIMQMSLTTRDIDSIAVMNSCQPSNMKNKSMDHFLRNLYYDNGDETGKSPLLYETSSSGLTELRGLVHHQVISIEDFNTLLFTAASDICEENDCVIRRLLNRFTTSEGLRRINNFSEFIAKDLLYNKATITEGKSEG